jgi:hypothetical protein
MRDGRAAIETLREALHLAQRLSAKNGDELNARWSEAHAALICLEAAMSDNATALRECVRLQRHYAQLLNAWDGGERRTFYSSEEWIARLREVGMLK